MCLLSWQRPAAHNSYISGCRLVIPHISNSYRWKMEMKKPLEQDLSRITYGRVFLYTNVSNVFILSFCHHCYGFAPLPYCVPLLSQLIMIYCEGKWAAEHATASSLKTTQLQEYSCGLVGSLHSGSHAICLLLLEPEIMGSCKLIRGERGEKGDKCFEIPAFKCIILVYAEKKIDVWDSFIPTLSATFPQLEPRPASPSQVQGLTLANVQQE